MDKKSILQKIRNIDDQDFGRVQNLCTRSNLIWTVSEKNQKKYIFCFHLIKKDNEWDCLLIPESNLLSYGEENKINIFSCPIGYLQETEIADRSWRDKVMTYNAPRILFNEIKNKFKELKKGEKIILETTSKEVPEVILISIRPLEGKAHNRVFDIPPTKLKGYRIK